jgi:type I site-specific restriction endonuclease
MDWMRWSRTMSLQVCASTPVVISFDVVAITGNLDSGKIKLSRKERAEQVKKRNYFTKYGEQAQKVINALLDKYADEGVEPIEETKILTIQPFTDYGTPIEIIKIFGGKAQYEEAVKELEQAIYSS